MENYTFGELFGQHASPNVVKILYVKYVLFRLNGNVTKAAAHTGVTESAFRYYLKLINNKEDDDE